VAAVIGREFDFALLPRAAGLDPDDAAAGVEELVRRRILHGVGERFDFTHDRIREVASSSILAPRRTLLHRRVGEAIETIYAADLDAHALALGMHYQAGEVWDRAAMYLGRAGTAALTRAANREAVACSESALMALDHLPDTPGKVADAIDLRIQIELALMGLGEFRRGLQRLDEAESLARAAGDDPRRGRVYYRMSYDLASVGELHGALAKGEEALALARAAGDPINLLGVHVVLSRALYGLGRYADALDVARRNDVMCLAPDATATLGGARAQGNLAFSRGWIMLAAAELGRFGEGGAVGEAALAASRRLGPHQEVWARLALGRLYVVQGRLARAVEVLEPGLPLCETGGDLAVYFSRTASALGEAYARAGRMADARALLERAAGHVETIGFAYSHALVVATLGEARLLAGGIDEAGRCVDEALALAREYGQGGWEAWARRLQGEVAARRDPVDLTAAEAHYQAAMSLAGERGMRPLLAHCHLGLGEAYGQAGDKARAAARSRPRSPSTARWTCRTGGIAPKRYRARTERSAEQVVDGEREIRKRHRRQ
jgi:tetratricopeptide (TPR) repeat protein